MDLSKSADRWLGSMKRAGLPVLPPVQAVIELGVVVLALLALDWLIPNFDLASFQPNPLWIPVLLLSLQYGTVSGLMAAGVAIAVTLFQGLPEQGIGENHFIYLLRVWAEPILWIGVAVLLGQFRMRQIAERQELSRKLTELTAQRRALAQHATNLRQRCDMLELELATRRETPPVRLLSLMQQARSGAAVDADAAGACLGELFPGGSASLFLLHDGTLRRAGGTPWPDGARWQAAIDAASPLYLAVIDAGRQVSVLDAAGESALAGEGLAAVPVRDAAGGVRGMLKLEAVSDPAQLDAGTLPALRMLADVIGGASPEARREGAGGAVTPISRPAAFGARLLRRVRGFAASQPEADAGATDASDDKTGPTASRAGG